MGPEPLSAPAEAYLDWLRIEKGRSPRTIASYRQDLKSFEGSLDLQQRELHEVDARDLDRYLGQLRAEGRSQASIARARSCLRGLFRFLVDEGEMSQDPTTSLARVGVAARLPKALSEQDATWLIESISNDDPPSLRDRAILELLYGTGARVSEIVGLDLSDMAYDDGLLRLLGKGDKERLVPLGRAAQAALGAWVSPEGRPRMLMASTISRADSQALFVNHRGRRLSRQGVHLLVQQRARRAGIEGRVSPHVLRHSCATHMLAHGADVRVVQELLGHASVSTTQIYTKVGQTHLREAYLRAHPRAAGPKTLP
jgi:site-specific recombinase XerD